MCQTLLVHTAVHHYNCRAAGLTLRRVLQSEGCELRAQAGHTEVCNSATEEHRVTNWAATTGLLHCVVQQKMTSTYVSVIEIKHLNTQIAQEAGSKDLCTALQFPFWLVIHCTSKKINLARCRRTAPFRGQAAVEDRRAPFLHSLYLVWSLLTFDLTLPSL